MNLYKNYLKYFGFGILIIICIVVGINIVIDPFQIYKKATFHKTIFMKEFYLNAGLIKQYDYDSVSVGSSMTQNFKIDELQEQLNFKKPIKLPVSGGSVVEHAMVLESAINTGKVKNVLFGLDIFSLNNTGNRLPEYLYDNSVWNDYKYIFSIDTLKRSFTYPFLHLTISKTHPKLDYNLMFQWQHNYPESYFSKEKVISAYISRSVNLDNSEDTDKITQDRMNGFNKYILKVVKDNPNIKFIFFYPPYSILTYKSMNKQNLDSFFEVKKFINMQLKSLPNVQIYDFQDDWDVITDLDNYKDITHYHSKINSYMLKQISNKEKLANIDDYINFMKKISLYKIEQ